ncbi:MAG: hypothetical protein K6G03_12105 [Lachnospiraceae bacterium]|nr:hypothetical protein [Lachnospiraceae bacterium]
MSGMNVVAHNLQGMFTNRQLGIVNNNRAKSSEKLASGYKINRATDDAAGLSISEKMRRQIRGLTQGTENAQDGISMCQVADVALAEVGDMLHRITELSVKSANGTNSPSDRQDIQEEINEILEEIDRISTTTKFNETELFKIGQRITVDQTEGGEVVNPWELSDEAIKNQLLKNTFPEVSNDISLEGTDTLDAKHANGLLRFISNYVIANEIYENGYTFPADADEIKPLYYRAHENTEYFVDDASIPTYSQQRLDDAKHWSDMGFNYSSTSEFGYAYTEYNHAHYNGGMNESALGMMHMASYLKYGGTYIDASMREFAKGTEEYISAAGVSDGELYELCDKMYGGYGTSDFYNKESTAIKIYRYLFENEEEGAKEEELSDEEKYGIWIQSGADNSNDNGLYLMIDQMDTEILGIDDLDASTLKGAREAIGKMEPALLRLNNIRSKIGAQQNRLEHTIKQQLNTVENTQAAESVIREEDVNLLTV